METASISRLSSADISGDCLRELARLLRDAVASGASVGWVSPPSNQTASVYWLSVAKAVDEGTAIAFAARAGAPGQRAPLVGTVQLVLSPWPSDAHRGRIGHLLVDSGTRRQGLGDSLMQAAEQEATSRGLRLLTLDTRVGDPAQALYEKLGYELGGMIPEYARSTTGELQARAFLYKLLPGTPPTN